jgi:hypothetical protein
MFSRVQGEVVVARFHNIPELRFPLAYKSTVIFQEMAGLLQRDGFLGTSAHHQKISFDLRLVVLIAQLVSIVVVGPVGEGHILVSQPHFVAIGAESPIVFADVTIGMT